MRYRRIFFQASFVSFTSLLLFVYISSGIAQSWAVYENISKLASNDVEEKVTAAEELGRLQESVAVEALIKTLKDPSPLVMAASAQALGMIGEEKSVQPIVEVLKSGDPAVKMAAANALGLIKSPQAVTPLIEALKDSNSNVRGFSAEALGMIGDLRAEMYLRSALEDESNFVRSMAKIALEAITGMKVMDESELFKDAVEPVDLKEEVPNEKPEIGLEITPAVPSGKSRNPDTEIRVSK